MLSTILLLAAAPSVPDSLEAIETAARGCGTSVVIQKLPADMERAAKSAALTFYPQVSLAPNATKQQRECVARRVSAFGSIVHWEAVHSRR
jgi:hypothetical protein